jgi:hypothetical protein
LSNTTSSPAESVDKVAKEIRIKRKNVEESLKLLFLMVVTLKCIYVLLSLGFELFKVEL